MAETSTPAVEPARSVFSALCAVRTFVTGLVSCALRAEQQLEDGETRAAFYALADMEHRFLGARAQLEVAHDRAPAGMHPGWLLTINRLQVDLDVASRVVVGMRAAETRDVHNRAQLADDIAAVTAEARRIRYAVRGVTVEWCQRESAAVAVPTSPLDALADELEEMMVQEVVRPDGEWRSAVERLLAALVADRAARTTRQQFVLEQLGKEVAAARGCLPSRAPTAEEMAEDPSALEGALSGVREALDEMERILSAEVARG